ncbi:SLC13 family permease [Aerococcaceae bacterium NML210727]|nr:SLC13 family permease [Aerococcaceae bacterium NML210727]MCW6653982.1 SLC13 family permease [Aerococcaceae bacterium NML201296]
MAVIKISKYRKPLLVGLAFSILGVAMANLAFNGQLLQLPTSSYAGLSILVASLILWIGVAPDWPSILCILCLGVLPEVGFNKALAISFGSPIFAFLLFTFIVTYALNQTCFLRRVTAWVLNHPLAQNSPWRFIVLFMTTIFVLSWCLSPTVIFMFVFPLYEEICAQFGWQKGDRQAALVLIALCIAISIGTAMTPINHVFALTALNLYANMTEQVITHTAYMSFMMPTGLVLYLILLTSLKWIFRLDLTTVKLGKVQSLQELPPVNRRERLIVAGFVGMILMWLLPEMLSGMLPGVARFFKGMGLAFPPMLIVVLFAVIQEEGKALLDVPHALAKGVHWQSMLLVGATLALGSVLALPEMQIVALLQQYLTPFVLGMSPLMIVAFLLVWTGVQTNFTSNLVTVTMVTTFTLTIYQAQPELGIHLAVVCCLIGFMSSLAFSTPPAMPYVAISVGSGWANSRLVLACGLWMLFWGIVTALWIGYPLGSVFL